MLRLACVDVPALPLQLLIRDHPDWKEAPVAVVAEDRPQAPLLYVNERARRAKILPGQRYGTALGLSKDLRAGVVSPSDVARAVDALVTRLRDHSPHVEPAAASPGVFWLDASGLGRLHPQLSTWAKAAAAALAASAFEATVVVGFTRFGSYAVARSGRGVKVLATLEDEEAAVAAVPLARLELEPDVRDRLATLGVRTVGEFLRLPAGGIRRRFGDDAHRLHELARRERWSPLVPAPPPPERAAQADLESPEANAERLLFLVKHHLDPLLAAFAARGEALSALRIRLTLDDGSRRDETVQPAVPTLDGVQLLGLVRLRLETVRLASGVVDLRLEAAHAPAAAEQVRLFLQSRRDPAAARRAFARLRATFGDDVVVRARLRDGHLPSSRFAWQPECQGPAARAQPRRVDGRPLVRRVYDKPIALPPRERHEPDGWLLRGFEYGRVTDLLGGPYEISGGWWGRGTTREYYFAATSRGDVLWIFYDRGRRRFYLEGRVE